MSECRQRGGNMKQKSEKYQRLKNPTRAMKKRELQQLIDEEYEI